MSCPSDGKLGESPTIEYKVEGDFDSVDIEIRNSSGTLVYIDSLQVTSGTYSTSWGEIKWNTGSHSGAYANPANGSYSVSIVGDMAGVNMDSDEATISPTLEIEVEITESYPGLDSIVAGVGDIRDVMVISVKMDSTEFEFSDGDFRESDITNGKKIVVDDSTLNSLGDGTWTVTYKYVRDEIGNFYDNDTSTAEIDNLAVDMELQ